MNRLETILNDTAERRREFPVTGETIYMAHAGVAPLAGRAAAAMRKYAAEGAASNQESHWALEQADKARANAAILLGAEADEIALLGPTSLGLSLVAQGVAWEPGDEVVYYADDYPANVYPWRDLERRVVKPVAVRAEHPGVITPADVVHALTDRTRLVALASCNFLSGYRIDINGIGKLLRERGVLFSLDAIQTLGAFPTPTHYVDFLAADSHKWLLGPAGAGVVYVAEERQEGFHPPLLGAANVRSPDFVAQEEMQFVKGARRYEPGVLNLPGIVGMNASMEVLRELGMEAVSARLLELRVAILEGLRPLGYRLYLEEFDQTEATDGDRSAIVTVYHPNRDMPPLFEKLNEAHVVASLRKNRAGQAFLRFSPHCYNTLDDVDRVVELLR